MSKNIKRGQIWFYRPSVERPGHIQKGPRPVIIVSNDTMNEHSPIVLAVPCTSQLKRNYPTHVLFVMNNGVSVALTEQAGPVCADELIEFKFTLPSYVMDQIDNALSISYGLKPMPMSQSHEAYCPRPSTGSKTVKESNNSDVDTSKVTSNKQAKWTLSRMKQFLLDFESLKSADEVASKYGLSVSTANTYKVKFKMLVGSPKEK